MSPMDGLMKKTMNSGEDPISPGGSYAVLKGDVVVPRDFMIKTAYVKKRRNVATAQDSQSQRSR